MYVTHIISSMGVLSAMGRKRWNHVAVVEAKGSAISTQNTEMPLMNRGDRMDFAEGLTIALIVLRLCGVIVWPWVWVLAPLWISLILGVILSFFIKEDDEK